jgi:hypothetical protein
VLAAVTAPALAPTASFAEGRDDPFFRCAFEDGTRLIFAERGDDTIWYEEGIEGDTFKVTFEELGENDPMFEALLQSPFGDTRALFILAPGTEGFYNEADWFARMIWMELGSVDGIMTRTMDGQCEEFTG